MSITRIAATLVHKRDEKELLAVDTADTSLIAEWSDVSRRLVITGEGADADWQNVLATLTYHNGQENPGKDVQEVDVDIFAAGAESVTRRATIKMITDDFVIQAKLDALRPDGNAEVAFLKLGAPVLLAERCELSVVPTVPGEG